MVSEIVFSLILPVYNVEKHLRKCMNSILNQTFKGNIEIILIDDGSTDQSGKICDEYAAINQKIKVIHKKNGGLCAARNCGMQYATGKYIWFIDSDDYIEDDALLKFYEEIEQFEWDVLLFSFFEEYYNNEDVVLKIKNGGIDINCVDKHMIPSTLVSCFQNRCFGFVWNCIYKRSLLTECIFNEKLKANEDIDFNTQVFQKVSTFKVFNYYGYHYAKRLGNSISSNDQNYNYDIRLLTVRFFFHMIENMKALDQNAKEVIFWTYTRLIYSYFIIGNDDLEHKLDVIKKDYLYTEFLKVEFRKLSFKQKILINLLKSGNDYLLYGVLKIIKTIKIKLPYVFAKIKK